MGDDNIGGDVIDGFSVANKAAIFNSSSALNLKPSALCLFWYLDGKTGSETRVIRYRGHDGVYFIK
jgi:hypothetical protein